MSGSYIPPLSKLRSPRRNWKTDGNGWAPRKRKSKGKEWRRNISAYYIIPCSLQEMKYHKFISPENVNPRPSYSWGQIPKITLSFHKKKLWNKLLLFPKRDERSFKAKKSLLFCSCKFTDLGNSSKKIFSVKKELRGRWAGNPISVATSFFAGRLVWVFLKRFVSLLKTSVSIFAFLPTDGKRTNVTNHNSATKVFWKDVWHCIFNFHAKIIRVTFKWYTRYSPI